MSKVKAASTEVTMEKHKQVVFDQDEASIACEELETCREVLLIGLASYGEVERLSNVQSNYASELYTPPAKYPAPSGAGSLRRAKMTLYLHSSAWEKPNPT